MFKIVWLFLLGFLFAFNAQAKEKDWALTSAQIKWIESEPNELLNSSDYIRWKKKYWVQQSEEDGKFKNIRYSYEDVTADGIDEILLQDSTPYGGGYAFAVFQKKKNQWKMIADDRGGFIFYTEPNTNNKTYTLVYYFRDAVDYYRTELQYKNGYYKIVKRGLMSKDITMFAMDFYDYFWSLNFTKYEYCRYQLDTKKLSNDNGMVNVCKASTLDLARQLRTMCDIEDLENYKKIKCN